MTTQVFWYGAIVMTTLTFNVAQLLREPVGGQRDHEFTEAALPLDETLTMRNLEGHVRFIRTAGGIVANIQCTALVRLTCVRSLEAFDQPVNLSISDEFHAQVDVVTGVRLPEPIEEDPFFLSELHMADIGELIREYTILELPLNPVCEAYRDTPISYSVQSDDIEGGDDADEVVDTRLAALKAWRDPTATDEEA